MPGFTVLKVPYNMHFYLVDGQLDIFRNPQKGKEQKNLLYSWYFSTSNTSYLLGVLRVPDTVLNCLNSIILISNQN